MDSLQNTAVPNAKVLRMMVAVGFAGMLAITPVALVVDHGFKSTTYVAPFEPTVEMILDGRMAAHLDKLAQKHSRFADQLRGHYNETLFRLGLYERKNLFTGPNGWMCFEHPLRVRQSELDRLASKRLGKYREVKARADRLGVKLLAVPAPDKVRIYPEQFVPEGMTPAHQGMYARILEELDACGIERIDVATLFHEHRNNHPDQPLYLKWDTHWTIVGIQLAAQAAVARIEELGWDMGPKIDIHFPGAVRVVGAPDLVLTMGFRSAGATTSEPESALVASFCEAKTFVTSQYGSPEGELVDCDPEQPEAGLAVCGTSFAHHGLHYAVAYYARRRFDWDGIKSGGGPWAGLEELLDRVERGESRVRVVVWEFVERFYNEHWFR